MEPTRFGPFERSGVPRLVELTGLELANALGDVAKLRIKLFRAFPYLYDGDERYEQDYLSKFALARDAVIFAAMDGDQIVGCATGSALSDYHGAVADELRAASIDLGSTFYYGESILLPEYRAQGLGCAFVDMREAWARSHGYRQISFCTVERPMGHPGRPVDYRSPDPFWQRRGYQKLGGAVAWFEWLDVDKVEPDAKPMSIWLKEI